MHHPSGARQGVLAPRRPPTPKCALVSPEPSLARAPRRRRVRRRSRCVHRATSRAPIRSSGPGGTAR